MRVLCVASHPDDEVLGVAGTLLKHRNKGDDVSVVLANRCRTEGEAESRRAEEQLGIEYERLWVSGRSVEDAVADYMPDVVYTHSLADLHHEHRALHERVLVATRPWSGVRAVYAFETPSATDWGMEPFRPVRFVDIAGFLDLKLMALEKYRSELRKAPHPRSIDGLEVRAEYWGQRIGVAHAEAFEVIRECA